MGVGVEVGASQSRMMDESRLTTQLTVQRTAKREKRVLRMEGLFASKRLQIDVESDTIAKKSAAR